MREMLRAVLANEPDLQVVGEAKDGREAVEFCCLHRPDLVLMDVQMPEMDGLAATREIKNRCPGVIVMMVTAYESPDYLLKAITMGAAGYVLKHATRQQLIGAVRRVLQGDSPLNQELAMQLLQRLAGEVDRQTETLPQEAANRRREPVLESLTRREREILRLLARGKTNRQITQELTISLTTVKTHIHRIISKLGVSDRTQAAVKAIELGLLPEHEE